MLEPIAHNLTFDELQELYYFFADTVLNHANEKHNAPKLLMLAELEKLTRRLRNKWELKRKKYNLKLKPEEYLSLFGLFGFTPVFGNKYVSIILYKINEITHQKYLV